MELADKSRYGAEDLAELHEADLCRMRRLIPEDDQEGLHDAELLIGVLHALYRERFKAMKQRAVARRQAEPFYREKAGQAGTSRYGRTVGDVDRSKLPTGP
jgi:hypothetical protein